MSVKVVLGLGLFVAAAAAVAVTVLMLNKSGKTTLKATTENPKAESCPCTEEKQIVLSESEDKQTIVFNHEEQCANHVCQWLVSAPEDMIVQLKWPAFDTKSARVFVYDGESEYDHLLESCTGSICNEQTSSGYAMRIEIGSESFSQEVSFEAKVTAIENPDLKINIVHDTCTESVGVAEAQTFQEDSATFAFSLYSMARAAEPTGNILFSPASISIALGMLLSGAREATRMEIKDQIAKNIGDQLTASVYKWLMSELNAPNQMYELHTANAIYLYLNIEEQEAIMLELGYENIVAECFGSFHELLNFKSDPEGARNQINAWVEAQTQDKIQELLPAGSVTEETMMVLVNAIYFKAEWLEPFSGGGASTTKYDFYQLSDTEQGVSIDFLKKDFVTPYYEEDGLQMLQLPYKENELSMLIVLPTERDGLLELEASLTSEKLSEMMGKLEESYVKIRIPKWTMTVDMPLKKVLRGLGIEQVFNKTNADLSAMTGKKDLYVTHAFHKAFIEVNEKGTEAAAATGMAFGATSAIIGSFPEFKADHPFFFAIHHKKSNNFLFMGSLTTVV